LVVVVVGEGGASRFFLVVGEPLVAGGSGVFRVRARSRPDRLSHGRQISARNGLALDRRSRSAVVLSLLGGPSPKSSIGDGGLAGGPRRASYPVLGDGGCALQSRSGGRVAHGTAKKLIERAAEVPSRSAARWFCGVRETPFNMIHLRNNDSDPPGWRHPFIRDPQLHTNMPPAWTRSMRSHRPTDGFLGLPQTDYYAYSGDETPAHRERVES